MHHFLYKVINLINNKIYIGVHSTENINDKYLGSGDLILSAIRKYGKDNFSRQIIQTFETQEEAYLKEGEIVDKDFIKRNDNYNVRLGGNGGHPFDVNSKEHKEWHTKTFGEAYYESRENMKGKTIWVKFDGVESRIRVEDWEKYRGLGWQEGRIIPNDFNIKDKILIRNIIQNETLAIDPEQLQEYISNGWEKGRIVSEKFKQSAKNKKKKEFVWIKNLQTRENKLVKYEDRQTYLEQGWKKGKIYPWKDFKYKYDKRYRD